MKSRLLAAIAAGALALTAPLLAPSAHAQAAARLEARDWSRNIVATPEGGFRMGNPAAPLKLVEYVSLTCGHCRQFAETGAPNLIRSYVRGGRVSFEIRAYPLDPIAATAAQLQRCAAPAEAFALNDAILVAQPQMIARLEALTPTEMSAIDALPPRDLRMRIMQVAGLDALARQHGVNAARARACIGDQSGADRLDAMKVAAERIGVGGTPSFAINGALLPNVHDWTALEPFLIRGR
jgi:protein-disulfide isomerase